MANPEIPPHPAWWNTPAYIEAKREKKQRMQEAAQKIREVYDSGTPFFTKDAIRDILQQVEKVKRGELKEVSIMGLDGTVVQQPVEPDFECAGENPYFDGDRSKVLLEYHSVDQLINGISFRTYTFLPLSISTLPWAIRDPLSLEEVRENFERKRIEWEASKQCDELRSILDSAEFPPIQKIVAFACYSMTSKNGRITSRSMGQHALILTIRDFLAKRGHVVQCYAQDPIYNDIDRQVLDEHGITVLDDPKGFLETDEGTVVISQAPNIPVRQIIADITRPAMMIWSTVQELAPLTPEPWEEDGQRKCWTDVTSPRLDKMVQEYVQLDFPQDPANIDFCDDTTIYVRKLAP